MDPSNIPESRHKSWSGKRKNHPDVENQDASRKGRLTGRGVFTKNLSNIHENQHNSWFGKRKIHPDGENQDAPRKGRLTGRGVFTKGPSYVLLNDDNTTPASTSKTNKGKGKEVIDAQTHQTAQGRDNYGIPPNAASQPKAAWAIRHRSIEAIRRLEYIFFS